MSLSKSFSSSSFTNQKLAEICLTLRTSWKGMNKIPWQLLIRYKVCPRYRTISFWEYLWWLGFHAMRLAGIFFSRRLFLDSWHPGLKHGCVQSSSTVLIISDMDASPNLPQACISLKKRLKAQYPNIAPVLVTGHADFALYSRLSWLIEYLPTTLPNHQDYIDRKKHYLAWRYRNALIIPLSAGLASEEDFKTLMQA